MKIDNETFNLSSENLTEFGLTLIDNDGSQTLSIGDDVDNADQSIHKHVAESDLATWDGVTSLLESGGTQVVKPSGYSHVRGDYGTYLCFGKSELNGVIRLGTTSEFCNIQAISSIKQIKGLMEKWPALGLMLVKHDYEAYKYIAFDEDQKKVNVQEANRRILDAINLVRVAEANSNANWLLESASRGFLNGTVSTEDISQLVSARRSFDASVAEYVSDHSDTQ